MICSVQSLHDAENTLCWILTETGPGFTQLMLHKSASHDMNDNQKALCKISNRGCLSRNDFHCATECMCSHRITRRRQYHCTGVNQGYAVVAVSSNERTPGPRLGCWQTSVSTNNDDMKMVWFVCKSHSVHTILVGAVRSIKTDCTTACLLIVVVRTAMPQSVAGFLLSSANIPCTVLFVPGNGTYKNGLGKSNDFRWLPSSKG